MIKIALYKFIVLKIIKSSIILIVFSINMIGQNINNPFVGTWEWQDGDNIFRVELFLDENENIGGHYSMFEVNDINQKDLLYESNKDIGLGFKYSKAILGDSDGSVLLAYIKDNTQPIPNTFPILDGELRMELITTSLPTNILTATWTVTRTKGLKPFNDNREFNIPTEIILTKVN